MTDSNKYKSVIIRKETHRKIKELIDPSITKISGYLAQLVDKEHEKKFGKRR